MTTPTPTPAPSAPPLYHINTSPATPDACYAELDRLGDLREAGSIPSEDYYPLDAALSSWLDELREGARLASLVTLNPFGAAERMEARALEHAKRRAVAAHQNMMDAYVDWRLREIPGREYHRLQLAYIEAREEVEAVSP